MNKFNRASQRAVVSSRHGIQCLFQILLPMGALLGCAQSGFGQSVRIAEYNIEADVNGNTTPNTGLYTVLEAIGEQNGPAVAAHPLDILGLEETTSNVATVDPIVTNLNTFYAKNFPGTAVYARSPYQATQSGGNTTGNGPNALVYNTNTLTLLASVGIGTPQGATNGEYRQVVRYEFQPVGGTAAQDFYVYVSHAKSSSSGTASADQNARNLEATIIRSDEARLPLATSALYMGDFNLDGSSEAAYKTLTATGNGQGVDPRNTVNNYMENFDSAMYKGDATESVTSLSYRDDIQFISSNVFNGTSTALSYIANSSRVFGNNGTTPFGGPATSTANTAFSGLVGPVSPSAAESALSTASDHYPVVSDYSIVGAPEPASLALIVIPVVGCLRRRRFPLR